MEQKHSTNRAHIIIKIAQRKEKDGLFAVKDSTVELPRIKNPFKAPNRGNRSNKTVQANQIDQAKKNKSSRLS